MSDVYARFNSTDYPLANLPQLNFSSRETAFTNITIDFTSRTIADLPVTYQEIQIIDKSTDPESVLYMGYANTPTFPAFNGRDSTVELNIELLSPQTYTAKRTIEIKIDKVNIHDALELIVSGLVTNDGFYIAENNLPTTKYLSDVFVSDSVEKILSNLAYRFTFTWYIDAAKNIYFRDLTVIDDEDSALDMKSTSEIMLGNINCAEYFKSIQPSFESTDYANRLNITNVKIIYPYTLLESDTILKTGQTYNFTYPFSLSENVLFRLDKSTASWDANDYDDFATAFYIAYIPDPENPDPESEIVYPISVNLTTQTVIYDPAIGFLGEDDADVSKLILFQRDSNNTNLITGFKWTGTEITLTYGSAATHSAIIPYYAVYIDADEIEKNKDSMGTSGIIEKIIDVNGKYFMMDDLHDYAISLFRQNNKQANQVKLIFEGEVNDNNFIVLKDALKLTKKIHIDLENCFVSENDYAITDYSYSVDHGIGTFTASARSANLNESFVDIFRRSSNQKTEDDLTRKLLVFYNQDEKTILSNQIIVNGEVVNV